MEILIVSLVAFGVALLTFFSGFGLGTLLTPVFMLFFPVELAIALTGVVHFLNNVFKLLMVGRHADREVLLRFGVPAVLAALAGSWLLLGMSDLPPLFSYEAFGRQVEVYPVKFVISLLLLVFAGLDFLPVLEKKAFGREKLPLGGVLSGFFGGLSGHQGALRSAFLIKAGLSKEGFVGTAAVVSAMVDFTRLGVYSTRFGESGLSGQWELVLWATLAGISGSFLGLKLLKKVTLRSVQLCVAAMLLAVSLAMGSGLL